MVSFSAVTEKIEEAGWYCFLNNLEDGYIVYRHNAHPTYEVIFSNWDLMDGGCEIRLAVVTEPFQTATKIKKNLDGLDEYSAKIAVGEFFELVDGYVNG